MYLYNGVLCFTLLARLLKLDIPTYLLGYSNNATVKVPFQVIWLHTCNCHLNTFVHDHQYFISLAVMEKDQFGIDKFTEWLIQAHCITWHTIQPVQMQYGCLHSREMLLRCQELYSTGSTHCLMKTYIVWKSWKVFGQNLTSV